MSNLPSRSPRSYEAVIPAKAGVQRLQSHVAVEPWIPAFSGMTAAGTQGQEADQNESAHRPASKPANSASAI